MAMAAAERMKLLIHCDEEEDNNDDDGGGDGGGDDAWLRAVSDVYRSTDGCTGERDAARDGAHSPGLPTCSRRCMDGDLFHRVLGAWCSDWWLVPLEEFQRAWFLLDRPRRSALLAERKVFAAELDVRRWPQNMLDRDDAAMLAALPPAALADLADLNALGGATNAAAWLAVEAVERGAHRCLAWLARDWPPRRWPVIAPPHVLAAAAAAAAEADAAAAAADELDDDGEFGDEYGGGEDHGAAAAAAAAGWACRSASENGHETVLRMLREQGGCACGAAAVEAAARAGRVGCLAYLLAEDEGGGPFFRRRSCAAAARGGRADCLRLLRARGCEWAPAEVLAAAAEAGSAACLEAALEDLAAAEVDEPLLPQQVKGDAAEPLDRRWAAALRRHAGALGGAASLCALAARAGAPAALRLLRERAGASWAANTCANAAFGGHLECLRLAHLGGCAWDETASASAAESGSLDCMRYAHEHGCPWAPRAPALAAGRGHLDCLAYARAHGCPWDATAVCAEAAFAGQLGCLRFALDHAPLPGANACAWAAAGGHLSCLQLLRARGCPWDRADCLARAARPLAAATDAADADSALYAWIEAAAV